MTVSAPRLPRPGRAVRAGRPAGVLWILLLVALLTALPCAGQARAADQDSRTASTTVSATSATAATATARSATGLAAKAAGYRLHAEGQRHRTWCSADGRPPHRDKDCSSHPYCAQDAQLPNPPPQPQPAVSPHTEAPEALPRVAPAGLLVGPHPAPDLYELQVHRS
ncbi:hypothetical protein F7Q99_05135 [Streptomyces kaniharaensis]|uniref:Uncharacterized protein n=1 Tax=Streptomyces kaniharaensis TaxID=212423 RepID=A0A6N7KMK1_9ACTN|nr:hypothetical protein [Streptomyces kaniharaensis]MQS11688.1 hypothetical protein [Streptomyces kaniharaensis]